MSKWQVFLKCPIHTLAPSEDPLAPPEEKVYRNFFSIIMDAPTQEKAIRQLIGRAVSCPFKDHKFTVANDLILGAKQYPPSFLETRVDGLPGFVSFGAPTIPPQVETDMPTTLTSANRRNGIVDVTAQRGLETLSIIYSKQIVALYDQLMSIAKKHGLDNVKTAILAFLTAHTGSTKTFATGFLQTSGFPTVTDATVGQALSRMKSDNLIYTEPAVLKPILPYEPAKPTRKILHPRMTIPDPDAKKHTLGEPIYLIPETTRTEIISRLQFNPDLAWWRLIEKPTPALRMLRHPIEYEWVKITRPTPGFRSAEDLKRYGPYAPTKLAKLPLAFAYFLVRQKYAEWVAPAKENVVEVENLLRFETTEKLKRQTTLF